MSDPLAFYTDSQVFLEARCFYDEVYPTLKSLACLMRCQQCMHAAMLTMTTDKPASRAGPLADGPANMAYAQDFTCPEICRMEAGRTSSSENIDAMAHDVWGLGYLLCWLLTGCTCFSPPDKTWEAVCKQHDEWVSLQQILLCFMLFTAACMTGRQRLLIWSLWYGPHFSYRVVKCLAPLHDYTWLA